MLHLTFMVQIPFDYDVFLIYEFLNRLSFVTDLHLCSCFCFGFFYIFKVKFIEV